jgi:hypothetical protein
MRFMDLDNIFKDLKKLLEKHSAGLDTFDEFYKSKAKVKKESYHLYGKEEVMITGKKYKVFLGGIVKQKKYVGFYFMPIYSDPEKFKLDEELKKLLHGKTCFYIKDLSIKEKLEKLLVQGIKLYKEKGWI